MIKNKETIARQNDLIILSFNDKEALSYTNHDEWYFLLMLNQFVTECFIGTLFVDIDNCPIPLTKLSFVVVPKALLLNPPSPRKPFEPRGPLLTAELNAGSDELLWNELALLLPTLKFLSVAVIVLNEQEYTV